MFQITFMPITIYHLSCRPIPEREYVEAYIKAYYLPENQLEDWLPEHKVYNISAWLWETQTLLHEDNKDTDQPAYWCSLISTFVIGYLES